jgi:hypothetical protein
MGSCDPPGAEEVRVDDGLAGLDEGVAARLGLAVGGDVGRQDGGLVLARALDHDHAVTDFQHLTAELLGGDDPAGGIEVGDPDQ